MPRDPRAYLSDILESCEAILDAVRTIDLGGYQASRLIRSSVEREFLIIGEALAALSRLAPDTFALITQSRRIVDFRNLLAHEYPTVDDALVWGVLEHDVPLLRDECRDLLIGHAHDDEHD